jgi:hypothetical protein
MAISGDRAPNANVSVANASGAAGTHTAIAETATAMRPKARM